MGERVVNQGGELKLGDHDESESGIQRSDKNSKVFVL